MGATRGAGAATLPRPHVHSVFSPERTILASPAPMAGGFHTRTPSAPELDDASCCPGQGRQCERWCWQHLSAAFAQLRLPLRGETRRVAAERPAEREGSTAAPREARYDADEEPLPRSCRPAGGRAGRGGPRAHRRAATTPSTSGSASRATSKASGLVAGVIPDAVRQRPSLRVTRVICAKSFSRLSMKSTTSMPRRRSDAGSSNSSSSAAARRTLTQGDAQLYDEGLWIDS